MRNRSLFVFPALALALAACTSDPAPELTAVIPGGFRMDVTEVTVADFRRFVEVTGYVTTADSLGWSGYFDHTLPGWVVAEGANWASPDGRRRAPADEPVTQVSYYDACAYCRWKGGELPSAAQWDAAAGTEVMPGNIWQGPFPYRDEGSDGFAAMIAPVGSFAPNAYGLYDMFGNVWEWTSEVPEESQRSGTAFIAGQETGVSIRKGRIIKGGSFLCDLELCSGFIPERFQVAEEDSGLNHLGFRCAYAEEISSK